MEDNYQRIEDLEEENQSLREELTRVQYYWVTKKHFDVELFCGIAPLRARSTS